MLWKLINLGFRRGRAIRWALVLYLLVSVVYFHLPWNIRLPVHRSVPQINRVLMRSGYTLMQGWDELALLGRDASAPIKGNHHSEQIYGGTPSQGIKILGRAKIIENRGYTVGYSESLKNPLWVSYRIFDVPKLNHGPRPSGFKTDRRTRAEVEHDDYTHSGFDRGHMAPNYGIATRYGTQAQKETFLMSNIIPQTPDVNRGIWKDLEMRVAKKYGRYFEETWVITGPVFEKPIEKLDSGVSIPAQYYKIIVDEQGGNLRILAFLISKECPPYTRIRKCLVSVDEIEQRTGLDFFPELDEQTQQRLESEPATRLWPWIPAAIRHHFNRNK